MELSDWLKVTQEVSGKARVPNLCSYILCQHFGCVVMDRFRLLKELKTKVKFEILFKTLLKKSYSLYLI